MTPVSISFKIEKASKTGQFVAGFASVVEKDGKPVTDTEGDVIWMEDLMEAAHDFINNARVAKVYHKGEQRGRVVESVLIDEEFAKTLGVTDTRRGWWIKMDIDDSDIRRQIVDGDLGAFSIGGSGQRVDI